jgi:hypothetical protein
VRAFRFSVVSTRIIRRVIIYGFVYLKLCPIPFAVYVEQVIRRRSIRGGGPSVAATGASSAVVVIDHLNSTESSRRRFRFRRDAREMWA